MSKQADSVGDILGIIFGKKKVEKEVKLSKIINNKLVSGNIIVDYYIPIANLIIEVHGIQHTKPQSFGGNKGYAKSKLILQRDRDTKLIDICNTNNINYIEIQYTDKISFDFIYHKVKDFM